MRNRQEWQERGTEIVLGMAEKLRHSELSSGREVFEDEINEIQNEVDV